MTPLYKHQSYKNDFPIFKNNPSLVYLDNAATVHKPQYVLDRIQEYITHSYSNIHRGLYAIAEQSEALYDQSKSRLATFLGTTDAGLIYTYNATYASNMIVHTLTHNKYIQSGDRVLIAISEHHASVVPRLWAQKHYGIELVFVGLRDDYSLDIDDFYEKNTKKVKAVVINYVSNTTGTINDLSTIKKALHTNCLFIVDGSQAIQHFPVDIDQIGCDFFYCTAHKLMADTGLGILRGKPDLLQELDPVWTGGDMIRDVSVDGYTLMDGSQKFEAGTPHIIGAISLLGALEYIDSIGGMGTICSIENTLTLMCIEKFSAFGEKFPGLIQCIGTKDIQKRVGIFSFIGKEGLGPQIIGAMLAKNNICIRAGGHCTHPLMKHLGLPHGTCRMSSYLYNTPDDIEIFFRALSQIAYQLEGTIIDNLQDDRLCIK